MGLNWTYVDRAAQADASRATVFAKNPRVGTSRFVDSVWDFDSARSDARINWSRFQDGSTLVGRSLDALVFCDDLVLELKMFAFCCINDARVISKRRPWAPATMVSRVSQLAYLLHEVQSLRFGAKYAKGNLRLDSLAEVRDNELKQALAQTQLGATEYLRVVLNALTSPLLTELTSGRIRVRWTRGYCTKLKYTRSVPRIDYEQVLPDALYRLALHESSGIVRGFLTLLRIKCHDKTPTEADVPLAPIPSAGSFRGLFATYTRIRNAERDGWRRGKRHRPVAGALRDEMEQRYGVLAAQMYFYTDAVRLAAETHIASMTGGRSFELRRMTISSSKEVSPGKWSIFSIVQKRRGGKVQQAHQSAGAWPCTDSMRDCLRALSELEAISHNPYVFSSSRAVPKWLKPRPRNETGLLDAFARFKKLIDSDKEFSRNRITPVRLRHTFVYHLARADVQLPAISYHLKHSYTLLVSPDFHGATFMYGNLKLVFLQRMITAAAIAENIRRNDFPELPPLSEEAAAARDAQTRSFFTGTVYPFASPDDIINHARDHMPFINAGLGYCGGSQNLLRNPSAGPTPCKGGRHCAPHRCDNARVTEEHAPAWEAIRRINADLAQRPELAELRPNYLEEVKEAERVLADIAARYPN